MLGAAACAPIDARARACLAVGRVLPDSGYFVSRTAAGGHLVFDAGPHGFLNGGHAHADALSVVLTVGGEPLLIDPGTGDYTMDPALRDRSAPRACTTRSCSMAATMRRRTDPFTGHRARTRVPRGPHGPRTRLRGRAHDGYHPAGTCAPVAMHGLGWLVVGPDRSGSPPSWPTPGGTCIRRGASELARTRSRHADTSGGTRLAFAIDRAATSRCSTASRCGDTRTCYGRFEPSRTIRASHAGRAARSSIAAFACRRPPRSPPRVSIVRGRMPPAA